MIYAFYLNESCYGYLDSWDMCKILTTGAKGAKYKKFKNKAEAGLYLKELIKNN